MKTKNLILALFSVMALGAITGCIKDNNPTQNPTKPEMVFVPVVSFTKSDDSGDHPEQQVTLGSFSISKYQVTQAQWTAVMGSTVQEIAQSCGFPLAGVGDNYPMYCVSWDDIQEYISKLNAFTGMNYRLPTDAEWEYAARGGAKSKGYTYSGSNNIDDVAWYYFNMPSQVIGKPGFGTQPVGTKAPNELGIYDMSGNVWEWCSDCFIPPLADINHGFPVLPEIPEFCNDRVVRGGAWDCNWGGLIVSYRFSASPDFRNYAFGFRLACSSE